MALKVCISTTGYTLLKKASGCNCLAQAYGAQLLVPRSHARFIYAQKLTTLGELLIIASMQARDATHVATLALMYIATALHHNNVHACTAELSVTYSRYACKPLCSELARVAS